jgi:3-methyladenine DNA glycosylase Mpg
MAITRAHDTADLVDGGVLSIAPRTTTPRLAVSARVGVAYAGPIADAPWRFYEASNRYVSRPAARSIGLGPKVAQGV